MSRAEEIARALGEGWEYEKEIWVPDKVAEEQAYGSGIMPRINIGPGFTLGGIHISKLAVENCIRVRVRELWCEERRARFIRLDIGGGLAVLTLMQMGVPPHIDDYDEEGVWSTEPATEAVAWEEALLWLDKQQAPAAGKGEKSVEAPM